MNAGEVRESQCSDLRRKLQTFDLGQAHLANLATATVNEAGACKMESSKGGCRRLDDKGHGRCDMLTVSRPGSG